MPAIATPSTDNLSLESNLVLAPSILAVDDDPCSANVVARLLTAHGYAVDTATDGVTALELVAQRNYGLLVLDYQMPGMNGVELYRHALALRPQILAVLLTAHPRVSAVFPAINLWMERVLAKPVDVGELAPLVERLIGPGAAPSM